jgi:putative addiction module component (TIGR02574 family)
MYSVGPRRGDPMRPERIKEEISGLGLSEKLLLVEDIWDSIAADNLEIPMPAWQKKELDKRYKEYKEGLLELHEYTVENNEIVVHSVFDNRQDPEKRP